MPQATSIWFTDPGNGPAYLPNDIDRARASAVIVYGTAREAGTNRYAAEQMQARFLTATNAKCRSTRISKLPTTCCAIAM